MPVPVPVPGPTGPPGPPGGPVVVVDDAAVSVATVVPLLVASVALAAALLG